MPRHSDADAYKLEVLPAEHKQIKDPITGVGLLFVTTNPAKDTNLYFHERSFLADESMLLFNSDRPGGGLMGYLFRTGELVRFAAHEGKLSGATAARTRNSAFAVRKNQILEVALGIRPGSAGVKSEVTANERVICTMPDGLGMATSLNESCDGKYLSFGAAYADGGRGITIVDVKSGALRDVCRIDPPGFHGHVQWSRTNPNLLSYAGTPNRLMVVDLRSGKAKPVYREAPGELVTHESWWVRDQILFVGGHRENEWHVKTLDLKTGEARIVGNGSWWPGATPTELARRNWWHASASENWRWVAAGTFHGSIVLFDAKTTRMVELTHGHRTYGGGEHPHVGWDRKGSRVVFASNMLGDVNVCVATIPEEWEGR